VSDVDLVVGGDRPERRGRNRQSDAADVDERIGQAPFTDQRDYRLMTLLDDSFQKSPVVGCDRVTDVQHAHLGLLSRSRLRGR